MLQAAPRWAEPDVERRQRPFHPVEGPVEDLGDVVPAQPAGDPEPSLQANVIVGPLRGLRRCLHELVEAHVQEPAEEAQDGERQAVVGPTAVGVDEEERVDARVPRDGVWVEAQLLAPLLDQRPVHRPRGVPLRFVRANASHPGSRWRSPRSPPTGHRLP